MGRNFLEVKDNLLTKKECADVIEWVRSNRNILEDENYEKSGYIFLPLISYLPATFFQSPPISPSSNKP